jgi:hypothetical protein
MTRKIIVAAAGEHPVEAAIREGKIPESRRAYYMALMAKRPKKTTKLLASFEAVLEPPEEMEAVRQYVRDGSQAARAAPVASGPSGYPEEWLSAREGSGRPASGPGSITFEDPMAAVGAISPELL